MQVFKLPNDYEIECKSEKTRYGFRHLAYLLRSGNRVAQTKACYYNRTWECFDFQTVAYEVIGKHFDEQEAQEYKQLVDKQGRGEVDAMFKTVGAVAKLGEIFCDSQEAKNQWKRRMLEAGLAGLDFPEDWDTLSEDERETRLNKVIALAKSGGVN